MSTLRKFLAKNYLLVIYPCLILLIVFSVRIFQFENDIQKIEFFKKVECDKLYYGKMSVNRSNREWCCETSNGEKFAIVTLNSFRDMDEVFLESDTLVWYNKETNRAYKYSDGSPKDTLQKQVQYNVYYLALVFLLSVVLVYENSRYNEIKY